MNILIKFLSCFFTIAPLIGIGQECDNIILNDGTEISAIVKEIRLDEIVYNKCDFLEGPVFVIAKNEVFMVKYKNGEKDMIQATKTESKEESLSKKSTSGSFKVFETIEEIPIDGKCIQFYTKGRSFYGSIEKFKTSSVYYMKCNSTDTYRDYCMKSSIVKIEDENGNIIYTKRFRK